MADVQGNGTLPSNPEISERNMVAEPSVGVTADGDPASAKAIEATQAAEDDDAEPSLLMQGLLSAVASLEGADTCLLGASMKALIDDLGLELMDISYMTVSQMVLTNLAAPFWGILADRGILQRRTILLVGALGQGLVTILLAFVTDLVPMVFLRAMNGALLAALRPISNGIVADTTAEAKRGKIFGRLQSALLIGMFITTMTVVPMANKTVLGFHGWRVAYVLVGLVSVVVSSLVTLFMREPPRVEAEDSDTKGQSGCQAVLSEIMGLLKFFRMPTFGVMIMQGIFGTIPWTVMSYMTYFFQLTGLPDGEVAVLTGIGPITGAFGNILGGMIADLLARRLLLHGRPLSAQLTVAMGVPLIYLTVQGVPPGQGSFGVYLALNVAFGVLGSWAQSGTNFPILSHIVPASSRSRVLAWECALENSIATAIGPTVVSLLAEKVFKVSFGSRDGDVTVDLEAADALGKALAVTICIPWLVCFLAYSLLHWSYPRDVRRLERELALERQKKASAKDTEPAEGAKRRTCEEGPVESETVAEV